MTDLEMTKLCAEAIGEVIYEGAGICWLAKTASKLSEKSQYDPLHDDAQAMALVKKFKLAIMPNSGEAPDHWLASEGYGRWNSHIDLNHAIVECVAKMQAVRTES